MTKALMSALAASLLLFGYKKEESTTTDGTGVSEYETVRLGEIKCDIDGVPRSFIGPGTNTEIYDDDYIGSSNGRMIQIGRTDENASIFLINILKDLDAMPIPSTYVDGKNDEFDVTPASDVDFAISYTEFLEGFSFSYTGHFKSDMKLTVTSKTGDVIKGTFEGWMFSDVFDFSTDELYDSIRVTNGEFKIQLKRGDILSEAETF